jgi:hypothetical protein
MESHKLEYASTLPYWTTGINPSQNNDGFDG